MTTETNQPKAAIKSKINWVSMVVIVIVSVLGYFGIDVTEKLESDVLLTITGGYSFLIMILRTYFSGSPITSYFAANDK